MSKHNGLSDTQELPRVPDPEYWEEPYEDDGYDPRLDTPHPRLQGAANRTNASADDPPRLEWPDDSQRGNPQRQARPPRQGIQQPRQRLQQPSPHSSIRRASYQDRLPGGEKSMPYRRPPQQIQPERREKVPKQRKRRRRRRHHSCLRHIILSVISLALVLFLLYSGIVMLAIRQIEYRETGTRQLTSGISESDPEVRNILLIGTDSRDGESGRADTMIVLSFSKHNHSVTMTSLMRDSYVSIPNHGTNKLNAAFAFGGATLLMDTIVNNYGIPIDDYICINFKAFVHIADALGGIKVEISDREAEEINVILQSEVNRIMGDDPMADFLPSGGTFTLNGKQALAYARIRHVGNADFERTERQRTVLNKMLDKVKHLSPTAIPKMLGTAMPELTTNVPQSSLYLLSLQTPVKLIAYDMQTLRLPADGTYSDQTAPDGQMVLAVDFDANHQLYLQATQNPISKESENTETNK